MQCIHSSVKTFQEFFGIIYMNFCILEISVHLILSPPCGWGQKESPRKLEKNSWFFHQENAPAHRKFLVKDFLAKNNVTSM